MRLTYENEAADVRVARTYTVIGGGDCVRERDMERMYDYVEGEWVSSRDHTRTYELADDGKSLAGDGSDWSGTGKGWRQHFIDRHYERLRLRFPNDRIVRRTPERGFKP